MNDFSENPSAESRSAQVLARLAALRAEYIAALPERAARIAALWTRFRHEGDVVAGREACCDIHRLAGASAVFGLAALGAGARMVEADMECALSAKPTDIGADDRLRHVLATMACASAERK